MQNDFVQSCLSWLIFCLLKNGYNIGGPHPNDNDAMSFKMPQT